MFNFLKNQFFKGIREEIAEIESSKVDKSNNLLKNAPHTLRQISFEEWNRPYPRQRAVFPLVSKPLNYSDSSR